jgi:hypothetical protein
VENTKGVPFGVRRTLLTTDWGWFRAQSAERCLAVYTLRSRAAETSQLVKRMPQCVVVPAWWYQEHRDSPSSHLVLVETSPVARMRAKASAILRRFDEVRASTQSLHLLAMKDQRPQHERDGVQISGYSGTLTSAWVDPYWYCAVVGIDPQALLSNQVRYLEPSGEL